MWPKPAFRTIKRRLHLDNAPEFHSAALARGAQEYGMRLAFRPPATTRIYRLIVAALETGCRLGELLALRWQNVDLERRELL